MLHMTSPNALKNFFSYSFLIFQYYIYFFFRSVVVVCKNMNATDVERLVPRLALPGCNPKHPRARRRQSRHQYTGRCIEVNQNQTASSSDLDSASSNCRGETDLCQSLENNSNGCSNQDDKNDVLCRLMHKVRHYLRTRYNVTEEEVDEDDKDGGASSPPAAVNSSLLRPRRKQLLRPNPTRAMPKVIVILVVAEMQLFTKKERSMVPHRCTKQQ